MKYRPWGALDWVLSLSKPKSWHFVGAIGTTERSICSWSLLKQYAAIQSERFARIIDVDSDKYRAQTKIAFETRLDEFEKKGGKRELVTVFDIMAELFRIVEFARLCAQSSTSIVLDITAFPKRFFFPILRAFLQSDSVRDILVTYTSASDYANDNPLYEDIEPWRPLPGFSGEMNRREQWIVSVGLLVESLRQYLGDNPGHERMKLLIPFPAPLGVLRRTWESVARLEGGPLEHGEAKPRFEKYRIDTLDMSSTFDRIVSLARDSPNPTAFAPFGPKPTSAAMCIYAVAKGSAVYYPQPTVYNPNYAIGIRHDDPVAAVNAYWIRHEGEDLYTV